MLALRKAIEDLIVRHETLRTVFPTINRAPCLSVDEDPTQDFSTIEVPAGVRKSSETAALEIVENQANRSFDLGSGPLFRTTLVKLGATEHILIYVFHHIVCDEWSLRIFHREVNESYRAYASGDSPDLAELPIQYSDFSLWQRKQLESGAYADSRKYWCTTLANTPTDFTLPYDHAPPSGRRKVGANHSWLMSSEIAESANRLGKEVGASPFMVTLAAFLAVLSNWAGEDDAVVATPTAGRGRPELEGLIGFFANTLIVRANAESAISFKEFLNRVRTRVLEGIARQDLPFDQIVEAINPKRARDGVPIFRVMFSHRDAIEPPLTDPDLRITPVKPVTQRIKSDLWLTIVDDGESRRATLIYDNSLYDEATISRVASDIDELLRVVVAAPETRLSALPPYNRLPRISDSDSETVAPDGEYSDDRGDSLNKDKAVCPDTVTKMREIWRDVLGGQEVGDTDDFFELGGHSMLALELFAKIDHQFGVSLPLTTLFEAPTFAEFTKAIASRGGTAHQKSVVTIQSEGRHPPIFALPGGGGSVISYALLGRSLGNNRPFYGLEHPGWDGEETQPERIADVAASFLAEIKQIPSAQSCVLLGACSGAVVAYELAQALTAQGHSIERVIMIEPSIMNTRKYSFRTSRTWRHLVILRFIACRLMNYAGQVLNGQPGERGVFLRDKLDLVRRIVRQRDVFGESARELNSTRVREATVAALKHYSPKPYEGPVTIVLGKRFTTRDGGKDISYWTNLCAGPVELRSIAGLTTGEMLKPPIVEDLSRLVTDVLSKQH